MKIFILEIRVKRINSLWSNSSTNKKFLQKYLFYKFASSNTPRHGLTLSLIKFFMKIFILKIQAK
jgi:hypothetical protein